MTISRSCKRLEDRRSRPPTIGSPGCKVSSPQNVSAPGGLALAEFDFVRPFASETTGDFREVAPGYRLPFRRSNVSYICKLPTFVSVRTEETVKEITVNQPLPDELFHIGLVDGVKVATDWRVRSADPLYVQPRAARGRTHSALRKSSA